MLKILKKIWPPLFILGSFAFVVRYFYTQSDKLNVNFHISFYFVALAALLQLVYWFVSVRCWQKTIELTALHKIGFIQGFNHLALTTLGKYFPGKIWGMVARASSMQQQGISSQHSVQATLNEQYLILHASALVSATLFFAISPSLITFFLCLCAILSVFVIGPLQKIVIEILGWLLRKFKRQELQYVIPLKSQQLIKLLAGYVLVWLAIGLMFSSVYYMLFPSQPMATFVMRLMLANTAGVTLGFFAFFSPGGLGVREAVTSGFLVSQLSIEDALLVSVVFRLWIVGSELLSGIALLIPLNLKIETGREL